VVSHVANDAARMAPAASAGRALAGFLLSGFLFALLGAVLPAWGYHRDPPEFVTIGNYFLSLAVGVIASNPLSVRILARGGLRFQLVIACAVGCAGLSFLALVAPPAHWLWRVLGLAVIGLAVGLLNAGLFHAVSASYGREPARTVIVGGIYYGLGCLAVTLLVAGTFYAYTVPVILILMAAVPGVFAGLYAQTAMVWQPSTTPVNIREVLRDFRSAGAILFALLLFCQFGNEWSIAGWLPLFLVRRLGMSPPASLWLLSLYWAALLVGRVAAVAVLPKVRHGRLLAGSVLAAMFGCLLLTSTNNQFGAATGVLLLGGGFASIYPLVAEKIGRRFPYYHPVFFSGIFSFALFGGLLAPATLGYAAEAWGIGVVMALPLLGTCTVSVLLGLIWLELKVTGR
jgi:FHS family glucose/mannose:H+ symporter-like MFS transporter